jgi:hypothetical protein
MPDMLSQEEIQAILDGSICDREDFTFNVKHTVCLIRWERPKQSSSNERNEVWNRSTGVELISTVGFRIGETADVVVLMQSTDSAMWCDNTIAILKSSIVYQKEL